MKMTKFILLSTMITVPLFVNAAFAQDGWVEISEFALWSNIYEQRQIRVETKAQRHNPAQCSDPDSYMVDESLPAEVKERIYSTLLSAYHANAPIKLFVNTNACERSRPEILNVLLPIKAN